MPQMREHRYDPRHALGPTYLREAYRQERSRNESLAGDIGQRIIYYTLVTAAVILTLGTTTRIARKISR